MKNRFFLYAISLIMLSGSMAAQQYSGIKVLSEPVVFGDNSISYFCDEAFDLQPGFGVSPENNQEFSLRITGRIPADEDLNKNWIISTVYDGDNHPIGIVKSFFNNLGKPTQLQTRNFRYNEILATQTLYDEFGRAVISTLPAPINAEGFVYRNNFITTGSIPYNFRNFSKIKTFAPDPVDQTAKGTLGWYYSNNNTLEPYVAATSYPYRRVDFHADGSGEVRSLALPGEEMKLGSGRQAISGVFPIQNELSHYFEVQRRFFYLGGDVIPESFASLSIDENNNYLVNIADSDGHLLFSAREGDLLSVENSVVVDKNSTTTSQNNSFRRVYVFNGGLGINYTDGEVRDLKNNQLLTSPNLGRGIFEIRPKANSDIATVDYFNKYDNISYHFYNQAGRLIASIAPEGVKALITKGLDHYPIRELLPYTTFYTYDFEGRLIQRSDPDAGRSKYMYRKDGRMRFSENQVQREKGTFSYTNYDEAGRPLESGEFEVGNSGLSYATQALIDLLEKVNEEGELRGGNSTKRDWVRNNYDLPDPSFASSTGLIREQSFVNGYVSYTENPNSKTWYSYDEQGRIKWSTQKINDLGSDNTTKVKTIDYTYDLLGNVLQVAYQAGKADAFYHHYTYDADKRLYQTFTSLDGTTKNLQATYHYYLHGPLKRVELADKLQGIDYVYTVQGMLKSINNTNVSNDPGKDGSNGFAQDVFGMTLDYFNGDYTRSNSGIANINVPPGTSSNFNGNIKAVASNTWKSGSSPLNFPISYAYEYDKKNQLIKATWGEDLSLSNNYSYTANTNGMYVGGYDQNGNILNANVNGPLIYSYNNTNKLDALGQGPDLNFFTYNSIGQLTSRTFAGAPQNGINKNLKFTYNVSGLVNAVTSSTNVNKAGFLYNEQGLRLRKTTYQENGTISYHTWYIYDTNGNVMSIYRQDVSNNITQTELPIYGSGRLGMMFRDYNTTGNSYNYTYELSDHLGNVRATIGRDKVSEKANVFSWADYNPWGSLIKTRDIVISRGSRYGYQGQYAERDPETSLNNFELRMYDPGIGRWLSPDPYRQYYSPYVGMGNNPVSGVDPDGGHTDDWYMNNTTKELKYFEEGKAPTEGYTYIASGSATVEEIRSGLEFYNADASFLNPVEVSPTFSDKALIFGKNTARDFVNSFSYAATGITMPLTHQIFGYEWANYTYTFDDNWNYKGTELDTEDPVQSVHYAFNVVTAILPVPPVAKSGVINFAVGFGAKTVIKKSFDRVVGYHH